MSQGGRLARWVLAPGLASLLPFQVGAQVASEALAIQDCASCRLEFALAGSMEGPEPDFLPGHPSSISRAPNGNFFVSWYLFNDRYTVHAPDGSFLRFGGREGSGPGEFRGLSRVRVISDTVLAFDTRNGRITILDTAGVMLGQLPFSAMRLDDVERGDAGIVVSGDIPTRDLAGLPLHEVDLTSGWRRSFGAARREAIVRPVPTAGSSRVLTRGAGGGVWAAKRTAYEIGLWEDGELTRRLVHNASWFPPYIDRPIGTSDPPPPWLMDVQAIGDRYLLVAIVVAVDDYTQLLGPKVETEHGEYYDTDRSRLLHDTIIHIVDTYVNTIVYRETVDFFIGTSIVSATENDVALYLYAYDETDGVPSVDIYRVQYFPGE